MSLSIRALNSWREAQKRQAEFERKNMEIAMEYEREQLIKELQRILEVNPKEIELFPVPIEEELSWEPRVFWEAIVDGLRFRYRWNDTTTKYSLCVAWECVNKCGNDVWYEVNSLASLGALLSGDRAQLPCYDCSEKEAEKYREENKPVESQEEKICPLLNKKCLQEKCAWFDESICGILTLDL